MAAIDMITAANLGVPTDELKPRNCHEAVLGWLIHGKLAAPRDSDQAWKTLRWLANRYGEETPNMPKQLTGRWFGRRVYDDEGTRIVRSGPPGTPFPPNTVAAGDVLYLGDPRAPHHSMVVTRVENSRAWVRGFNNAGAFGGPFMQWDPDLHDILDPERWTRDGEFMALNGPAPVYRASYQDLVDGIPRNLDVGRTPARPMRQETRRITNDTRESYQDFQMAEDYRIWDEWAAGR